MTKRISLTSVESYKVIKEKIGSRQLACVDILKENGPMTANELAMKLFENGITPYFNRNFVHPRLTELVDMGIVKVSGTKIDGITKRRCRIYELC